MTLQECEFGQEEEGEDWLQAEEGVPLVAWVEELVGVWDEELAGLDTQKLAGSITYCAQPLEAKSARGVREEDWPEAKVEDLSGFLTNQGSAESQSVSEKKEHLQSWTWIPSR